VLYKNTVKDYNLNNGLYRVLIMIIENVNVGPKFKELSKTLDMRFLKDYTFIGRASGRSMEGVGIYDGDLLIIDRSKDVQQNDVIVACLMVNLFVRWPT